MSEPANSASPNDKTGVDAPAADHSLRPTVVRGLTLIFYSTRGIVVTASLALLLLSMLPAGADLKSLLRMLASVLIGGFALIGLAGLGLSATAPTRSAKSYLALASLVLTVIALGGAAIHYQIASPVDNPALVRTVNASLLACLLTGQLLYLLVMRPMAVDINRVDIRRYIDVAMALVGIPLVMALLSLVIFIVYPELHLAPSSYRLPFPIAVVLGMFAFIMFADVVSRLRKGFKV